MKCEEVTVDVDMPEEVLLDIEVAFREDVELALGLGILAEAVVAFEVTVGKPALVALL